jgi:DNA-binding transcriptional MerR regulator
MERAEVLGERVRHEQRLLERLQTANIRFADAQLERLWAIKSAHELGLSIRQIAAANGVSSSRIHQVVQSEDPTQIPIWATDLRETGRRWEKETFGCGSEAVAPIYSLAETVGRWIRKEEHRIALLQQMSEEEWKAFPLEPNTRVLATSDVWSNDVARH